MRVLWRSINRRTALTSSALFEQRDQKEAAADGYGIFQQGDDKIRNLQRFDQPRPRRITDESADYATQSAKHRADDQRLTRRRADGRARQAAEQEAHRERPRRFTAGRLREFISHQLNKGERREDVGRDRRAHKSQRGMLEVEPLQMRGPADDGRRGQRTQARDDADGKRDGKHGGGVHRLDSTFLKNVGGKFQSPEKRVKGIIEAACGKAVEANASPLCSAQAQSESQGECGLARAAHSGALCLYLLSRL